MSLPHAILGFLAQQPMTGYDLKTQCFDVSVANFWPADQAQIYRTLDRLEEQGFAVSTLEVQRDRPNRKVYTITAAGRGELRRWLTTPLPLPLPLHREPFLVQLYFATTVPNATLLALLEEQAAAHEAQARKYEDIFLPGVEAFGPGDAGRRAAALAALTLDLGRQSEEMYLRWIHHAIEQVRSLPDPAVE